MKTFGVLVEISLGRGDVGFKLFFGRFDNVAERADALVHLSNEILFDLKNVLLVLSLSRGQIFDSGWILLSRL